MKTVKESGDHAMLEALSKKSTSGIIENQEARGQKSFCASTDLPVDCGDREDVLEGWGIKLGEPYENDPIFRPVELSAGWKKVGTDHSMWNHLLDDKGRVRAEIFYKAAFYDRNSFLRVKTRFSVEQNYDDGFFDKKTHVFMKIQHRVLDGQTSVFSTPAMDTPLNQDGREDYKKSEPIDEAQRLECREWLKERYPDWKDPSKCWDEESCVPRGEENC